ncbi:MULTISPECIES: hypothetical protein [unclassified Microbacterium]|uniref:hypothetical protein n=1 Tax=unclassified Microbacterium TaxID=2609290 RepID=UPI00386E09F7
MSDQSGRSLAVDEGLASRLARAYLRWQIVRPAAIILFALIGLFIVTGVVLTVSGDRAAALPAVLLSAAVVVIVALWYFGTRASVRQAYPVGSVPTASVTADSLISTTALGSTELRFSALRAVDVAGDAVILRVGPRVAGVAILPRALFTDDDIARLRSATRRG